MGVEKSKPFLRFLFDCPEVAVRKTELLPTLQAGSNVELDDVSILNLVPEPLQSVPTADDFLAGLPAVRADVVWPVHSRDMSLYVQRHCLCVFSWLLCTWPSGRSWRLARDDAMK